MIELFQARKVVNSQFCYLNCNKIDWMVVVCALTSTLSLKSYTVFSL
jgi:hypothetical protein